MIAICSDVIEFNWEQLSNQGCRPGNFNRSLSGLWLARARVAPIVNIYCTMEDQMKLPKVLKPCSSSNNQHPSGFQIPTAQLQRLHFILQPSTVTLSTCVKKPTIVKAICKRLDTLSCPYSKQHFNPKPARILLLTPVCPVLFIHKAYYSIDSLSKTSGLPVKYSQNTACRLRPQALFCPRCFPFQRLPPFAITHRHHAPLPLDRPRARAHVRQLAQGEASVYG